jgi:hypothetical protein
VNRVVEQAVENRYQICVRDLHGLDVPVALDSQVDALR